MVLAGLDLLRWLIQVDLTFMEAERVKLKAKLKPEKETRGATAPGVTRSLKKSMIFKRMGFP